MPSYAAFLGHQPLISLAELSATVPGFAHRKTLGEAVVLFESPAELDASFLDGLGGIVILARRISENAVTVDDLPAILTAELSGCKRGKLIFALRAFGLQRGMIRTLYRRSKEAVRKIGRPCRYVGNDHEPAATVLLRDAGLLDGSHGCEIVLIRDEEDLWIGRTVAAQDVAAYTRRDMQKPVRDTTVGLLPPKLAQILLNFGAWMARGCQTPLPEASRSQKPTSRLRSGQEANSLKLTVFDPFCGTGVIPLECLIRGWDVLASDMSQKAVNGCQKNLEWLRKEWKVLKKDVASTVFKQDATKPFVFKKLPDLVVTETSLGPSLTDRPSQKDAAKMKTEAERLEAAFIENCARTLPGVPLVLTWPFWKIKNDTILLERALEAAHAAGYMATLPPGIAPTKPDRLSLLYRRPNQFVGREIVLLMPRRK